MLNRLANRSQIFEFCFQGSAVDPLQGLTALNSAELDIALISDAPEKHFKDSLDCFSEVIQLGLPVSGGLATEWEKTTLAQSFAQTIDAINSLDLDSFDVLVIHCRGFHLAWDAPLDIRQRFVEEDDPDAEDFFEPPMFDWSAEQDIDPDKILAVQQAFQAQLLVFDLCLGVLLDFLEIENKDNLSIALTSSGGYALGEHQLVGDMKNCPYSESIHVPFVVFHSNASSTTLRHQELFYLNDLCDQFLAGYLNDHSTESTGNNIIFTEFDDATVAARTLAWHFVHQQNCELYTKPDDRHEINEISSRRRDIVEQFTALTKEFLQGSLTSNVKLDQSLTETLNR